MTQVPKPPKITRVRPWRRAVLTGLALPPLLMSLFGLTAAYRIYASNRSEAEVRRFPIVPAPAPPQNLLVFAPHCDDETLGAGGLMRQARLAGADVHVVVISNGDGFRVGVEREYKELQVAPADYIRYAYHRQDESRAALQVLGVAPSHVTFLGYPDRGLMPMWTTNWAVSTPFLSYYTHTDHSPYTDSPTLHAPYAGAALLLDIERQMRQDQPTDIYVTHPADDHPDHAAASVFVQTALAGLRAQGEPWAQTARLHFYLVHRGDWPIPQGLHEDLPLPPPAPMASLDTRWEQLPLSKRDVQKKYAAIKRYRSQTELTGRFLFSFARRTELFGTLPPAPAGHLALVPEGRMRLDGRPDDWIGLTPVLLDPASDTVLRAFQGSGDILRVFACRDHRWLYLRLDARQRLSSRVTYSLSLRPVNISGPPPPFRLLSIAPTQEGRAVPLPGVPGGLAIWRGACLEARLPLSAAGLDPARPDETLYVAADTRFAGLSVDHTGFRAVSCAPVPRLAASR